MDPTMTKWRTAVLVAMLLSGCSKPQQQTAAPAPSLPAAAPSGEQLLAEVPPGWVQSFRSATPDMRMVEYIPPGTDLADWTDKLSFASFGGEPLPDPVELVTSIANEQRKSCDGFESHATYSGGENGYPTAVQLFVCNRNLLTQKGQLTLLKTIRGDENFYVITRARRVDPIAKDDTLPMPQMPQEVMAAWSLYLRAIGVCNTNDPAHPCPEPGTSQAPGASREG
jgi:hypothetical protein